MTTQSTDLKTLNTQGYAYKAPHPKTHIGGLNPNHPQLISAVLDEDLEEVKALLQHKVNVDCTSNDGGFVGYTFGDYTPLVIAAIKGNKEMVQILLDAKATPVKGSYYGKNALEWAQELHYDEIVELIKEA